MPPTIAPASNAAFERRLALVLVVGFCLRLAWALAVPVDPVADSVIYARTAENLALHGVFGITPDEPFSYWPVGTSAIYALGYVLFGVDTASAVGLNLAAGLLLVYTSALLARRWFGERTALWVAILLAAWPSLVMYVTLLASEIFFAVFVNLALLAWRSEAQRWKVAAVLAGLMIAAASYVRPVALLLPLVLASIELLRAHRPRRTLTVAAIALATAMLAIAPWAVRNLHLHGGLVIISTNGGPNLWMGNNPGSDGGYMPLPESVRTLSEYDRAAHLGNEAKRYMLENPARTAAMFLRKLADTHARETIAVHWNGEGLKRRLHSLGIPAAPVMTALKLATQAYWIAVLLAALGGAATLLLRARGAQSWRALAAELASPPLVLWGYFAVLHALIVSQDRYHFPSIPFIAMLAAWGGLCAAARWHPAVSLRHP